MDDLYTVSFICIRVHFPLENGISLLPCFFLMHRYLGYTHTIPTCESPPVQCMEDLPTSWHHHRNLPSTCSTQLQGGAPRLAKLVQITSNSLWFMVDISILFLCFFKTNFNIIGGSWYWSLLYDGIYQRQRGWATSKGSVVPALKRLAFTGYSDVIYVIWGVPITFGVSQIIPNCSIFMAFSYIVKTTVLGVPF